MYKVHKDYFNNNKQLIFTTICYFDTISYEKIAKIKKLTNSPSLDNQIERYGKIEGTKKYNNMRAKNSKNRIKAGGMIKQTLKKKYGDENYVNVIKCKETKLERYGSENYNNLEKMKETCISKYGVDNVRKSEHFHILMVEKGKHIPKDQKSDFQIYKEVVNKITQSQNIEELDNFDKRGRLDLDQNAFHLDHKISKQFGFLNNIPTYIIGNIHNLEFIEARLNCSKQDDCSITLDTLIKEINENN
jgi:hypothetical protein